MALLRKDEPEPAAVHRAGSGASLLFICDHAGRATPRALGDLGVPAAEFERHIAWDIGAADLTLALADRIAATAILQRYSRLVVDCNRDPARADAMPEASDGTPIPANAGLTPEARAERVAAIHAPYHAAITAELDAREARGVETRLVFVHSFTPRMAGFDRPWRYGVLHLGGSPFADAMLAVLREDEADAPVGDNQPYAMDVTDYSAPLHGVKRGLDFLEIEVRQDLLATPKAVEAVAAYLAPRIARAETMARR